MAEKITFTPEEIGKMRPAERSAAWHYATPESQAALFAANQTELGGTHDFDAGTGTWNVKKPTKPVTRTADYMSALAGGYNFDENKIRSMFDQATQKEYAAKRAANANAQNQYAGNVGGYINTLSDTMRQSLNKAVATGGSRGLAAAEAMQAAQDATLQTSEQANNLALERMQLDYDEAEAYAKNVKDAEALSMERKANALTQALQLGQIDAQTYAAEMGALGNYYYSGDSARQNFYGNVYTADKNAEVETRGQDIEAETTRRGQDLTFNTNSMGQLLGILQSNNVTAEGRTALEGILRDFGFNIPEGSLQASPTPTYSGGGGGGSYGNDNDNDNESWAGYGVQAQTDLSGALMSNDPSTYVGYYMQHNPGAGEAAARADYKTRSTELFEKTETLGHDEFVEWCMSNVPGITKERASEHWNYWNPTPQLPKVPSAANSPRYQPGSPVYGK